MAYVILFPNLKKIFSSDYRFGGVRPTWPPVPTIMRNGSFSFSFDVTKKMMPRCKMVVYYMRDDEMVADDTTFDVQDILENEVR